MKVPAGTAGIAANTERLAAALADHTVKIRSELYARMMVAGLTPEKGWRVSEVLSQAAGGTLWTFRPIHSREPSPDMSVSVLIDEQGRIVSPGTGT